MIETLQPEDIDQRGSDLIDTSQMYESLRYNDYSVENGLGEIVDNSVEAGAKHIKVRLHTKKVKSGKKEIEVVDRIEVADDGCGMDIYTLAKCLVLGCSMRERRNGRLGIGRFGVGMTLGGISLARHIDVYSKNLKDGEFYHVYIDLDEIKEGNKRISPPTQKEPPDDYKDFFDESTGTVVVLSECDRMDGSGRNVEANELRGILTNYLGRTYRKFIEGGTEIFMDDAKVFLHDPLYIAGPTFFDTKDHQDPKATLYGERTFDWDIPDRKGEKAQISIKLSLLPQVWRTEIGDGGRIEARKRRIDQNEGISILRANREVLYDKVPYLIGRQKGQFAYKDIDRWWGCEISFPAELDECFQVRYIKRGAEPIGALKDRIRLELTDAVLSLRKRIKEERAQAKANQGQENGDFDAVIKMMTEMDVVMPMNQAGRTMSEEEESSKIEEILDQSAIDENESAEERENRRKSLQNELYSIVLVKFPAHVLFETDMLLGDKVVIKLNVNHTFYTKVIEPLCGDSIRNDTSDESMEKNRTRDALMLLLLSFAKAKASIKDSDVSKALFEQLEMQWGTVLSAVSSKLDA